MAYGDKWDFVPEGVGYQNYADGTVIPYLEVKVMYNGKEVGYVEIHMHRTKYPPHASIGVTSRIGVL